MQLFDPGILLKNCNLCLKAKPLTEFNNHRRGTHGKNWWCKECAQRRSRETWAKNRTKYCKAQNKRQKRPEIAARRREYLRDKYRQLKDQVIEAYGGCCAQCGYSDYRALCIDHVHGGGGEERRLRKKGTPLQFVKSIIDAGFPDIYQILCCNCNQIKGLAEQLASAKKRRTR